MDLVVGATGHLGSAITQGLLARGRDVRILVRPGSDASALIAAGAVPVTGDLKDPASLEAACAGVDVVVTTANSAMRGGDDNPETVEVAGNRALIDAARAAGVEQFVFVSALGAAEDHPVPFMRGKAMAERHLRESGVPWTIVAPNAFIEVWVPMAVGTFVDAGRPVTLIGEGRRRHGIVSMRDVVAFTVAAVGHPAALNRYLPLCGPDDLTWPEIAGRYARARGRTVEVRLVPHGSPIPDLPEFVQGMLAGFDTYDSVAPMDELWATFRIRPTPMEEALGLSVSA